MTPQAELLEHNAECLHQEITWLAAFVNARLTSHFPAEAAPNGTRRSSFWRWLFPRKSKLIPPPAKPGFSSTLPAPPSLENDSSTYAELGRYYQMNAEERFVLLLALLPHLRPQLFDVFFTINKNTGRGFTEFGGLRGNHHSGFLPTIETALFLLAGEDLEHRFRLYQLFEPDHFFSAHNILHLPPPNEGEPSFSARLSISEEYVDFFTIGKYRKPQFSTEFPAKRLTTSLEWDDLVMDAHTARQVDDIRIWLEHNRSLMHDWGMNRVLKPGFKVLFYGPPGTGKTLTAALLGKLYNLEVYRIDLSMVISKYIGETEKNLEKVFRRAEHKNWILFFDEADALFGKRTNISDAHDKYANQEISYLLQRLEDYPGLVILASNMRQNVDEAFARRLQVVMNFPKPQPAERLKLWQKTFSPQSQFGEDVNLEDISRRYDLAGGSIINVVQYASLQALSRGDNIIRLEDLKEGIRKELLKEGKTI